MSVTETQMKAALQQYLDGWNNADLDSILTIFADTAEVHDPHGTEPKVGAEAIREFFTNALKGGLKLTLDTPIRASAGDSAAMAFTVTAGAMTIKVIDIMRFNPAGKVIEMHGYWGQSDVS